MSELTMRVVYDHPSDFPDRYVARLWEGEKPTSNVKVSRDVEKIRRHLAGMGMVKLMRSPEEDPVIMEFWL